MPNIFLFFLKKKQIIRDENDEKNRKHSVFAMNFLLYFEYATGVWTWRLPFEYSQYMKLHIYVPLGVYV